MSNVSNRSSSSTNSSQRPHTRFLRSIRWPGNKSAHLKWLLPLPPECAHYIEPFCGSAAVLLNRPISRTETCNDLDGEMVNFLKIVREQSDELRRLLDRTPYSRAEFAASLSPSEHLTGIERARRFYVRVMQSHFGFSVNALPSHWETPNNSRNGMALASARFRSGLTRFDELASRLRVVSFDSRPATAVIAAMDDTDKLFYCDPPYVTETWTRTDKSYTNVMNDDDHRDLARIINDCRGQVALSGYESALYTDLFAATRWRKLLAPPKISRASGRMRQEVLWCNYGEDGERLRPTLVNGALLEIPTADPEVDALVSHVALAASDAWRARGRQHRALHAFMAGAYGLAIKLKNDESEFNRVMRARGIEKPKLADLYYQVVRAFQPEKQRADPESRSDASRLKRAFIQAEALDYTPSDFVRRIERKEDVSGRKISGVNKLIKMAQLAKRSKQSAESLTNPAALEADIDVSSLDLSRYIAVIFDRKVPLDERVIAMNAAADELHRAGVAPTSIDLHFSTASGHDPPAAASAFVQKTKQSRAKGKIRSSGKARNKHDILSRSATLLPFNHPAMIEKRTIYPGKVTVPGDRRVLIEGVNNAKTGPRILKGKWKGLHVYTLTLEERATCPSGCEHWRSCFGNNMQWAQRFAIGPALDDAIRRDVAELTIRHPAGIAVRLHILGDFYSPAYVQLWAELLRKHVTLRVFGFSRRWDARDPIAEALRGLIQEQPERFRIRLSNAAPHLGPSTVSVEYKAPSGAIICPAQKHQTETCSTCALCWSTDKQIAFIQH